MFQGAKVFGRKIFYEGKPEWAVCIPLKEMHMKKY
jgi:hypothetical protein